MSSARDFDDPSRRRPNAEPCSTYLVNKSCYNSQCQLDHAGMRTLLRERLQFSSYDIHSHEMEQIGERSSKFVAYICPDRSSTEEDNKKRPHYVLKYPIPNKANVIKCYDNIDVTLSTQSTLYKSSPPMTMSGGGWVFYEATGTAHTVDTALDALCQYADLIQSGQVSVASTQRTNVDCHSVINTRCFRFMAKRDKMDISPNAPAFNQFVSLQDILAEVEKPPQPPQPLPEPVRPTVKTEASRQSVRSEPSPPRLHTPPAEPVPQLCPVSLDQPCLSLFHPDFTCNDQCVCPYFHEPDCLIPAISEFLKWGEQPEIASQFYNMQQVSPFSSQYTPFTRRSNKDGLYFSCVPIACHPELLDLVRNGRFRDAWSCQDIEQQCHVSISFHNLTHVPMPTAADPLFINIVIFTQIHSRRQHWNHEAVARFFCEYGLTKMQERIEAAIETVRNETVRRQQR